MPIATCRFVVATTSVPAAVYATNLSVPASHVTVYPPPDAGIAATKPGTSASSPEIDSPPAG